VNVGDQSEETQGVWLFVSDFKHLVLEEEQHGLKDLGVRDPEDMVGSHQIQEGVSERGALAHGQFVVVDEVACL